MIRLLKNLIFIFFALLAISRTACLAQSSDEQLAQQFIQDEEYEKALPISKSLWQKDYSNPIYYEWLLKCYIHENKWDKAKYVVQKTRKKTRKKISYNVDLIYLQRLKNNDPAVFEKYIDNLPESIEAFQSNLKALEKRKQTAAIVRLLERAEFIFDDTKLFGNKLTTYYLSLGQKERALRRIVLQLGNPFFPFERAKSIIEMNVTDRSGFIMLRDILLLELQTKPNAKALNQLLNWSFVQLQDWQTAYIFNKSLDTRLRSKGKHLYAFGTLCMENLKYKYATKAFKQVLEYGKNFPFYEASLSGSIQAQFQNINATKDTTGLYSLYKQCILAIPLISNLETQFPIIRTQANIYSKYYHKPEKADILLDQYIQKTGLNPKTKALAKIEQAQVLVLLNDMWTSELLYAQVEKEFGENPLGQRAKFYRAQLSYYRGDFEWSNLQLNVLKAATTQLISNNAIDLSLVITENLGLDSNYDALERFAKAQLLAQQQHWTASLKLLDSIDILYPGVPLSDNILLQKGMIYEAQRNFKKAAGCYQTLSKLYAQDVLADDALFKMGMLYLGPLDMPEKAKAVFQKIITELPGSLFAIEARKYYRKLRGDHV